MQATESFIQSKPLQSQVIMEPKHTSKSFRVVVLFCLLLLVVYSIGLTIVITILARNHSALQTYATSLEKRIESIEQTDSLTSRSKSQKATESSESDDVERLQDEVTKSWLIYKKFKLFSFIFIVFFKSKHWSCIGDKADKILAKGMPKHA